MEKIIAYCGLACDECGAYIATMNDDDEKRKETAELWSKEFGGNIKAGDINCTGCLAVDKNVYQYCRTCKIRKCGISKKLDNCAFCDDYACDKLLDFFKMVPDAKKRLDEVRSGIS